MGEERKIEAVYQRLGLGLTDPRKIDELLEQHEQLDNLVDIMKSRQKKRKAEKGKLPPGYGEDTFTLLKTK